MGGVDIVVIRPSQDILDLKAWGDHIESDHLTILVLVYYWCFDTRHEGYQPEEGLMSLIHLCS